VKTRTKWAIAIGTVAGSVVLTYVATPYLVTRYINSLKPGIHVDKVKLKSLKCADLIGVSIDRPNVKGTILRAFACKNNKSIEADGGNLDVNLIGGDGDGDGDGYNLVAKNIDLLVRNGKWTVEARKAGFDSSKVCSSELRAKHPRMEVHLTNFCFDRKADRVSFDGGDATPDLMIHETPVGKVTFSKGTLDLKGKLEIDSLVRQSISAQGLSINFEGGKASARSRGITVSHERLFPGFLTFHDVSFPPVNLENPIAGDLWVSVKGVKVNFNLSQRLTWGEEPCQKWLDAIPDEMKTGPLSQVRLSGLFKFHVKLKPDVKLTITNTCKLDGPIPDFIKVLDRKFTYTAYHPGGKPFQRESGVGTPDWVPLQMISPNMATALTTTEDPGFFGHRGFITAAIEHSLRDNLKLGRFFRGGSTLSMQLSKNLWLSRKRTVGRKIQEAILTVALESSLSKDRILELYLNVVEFGPDIYGIGPACRELLHKDPRELSIPESLYLVLRLPAPTHSSPYESKKALIKKLLDNIAASGKVPHDLIEIEKALMDDSTLTDDSILP